MALGTVITLDLNFTGPDIGLLPKVSYVDAIEAAGSLFLLETGHPVGAIPAGVPVHGATYPNLFASQAAPLLGSAATGALVQSVYTDGTFGKVERSAKGGIHAIQSTKQTALNHGFQLRLPKVIVDYFRANSTHKFYVSQWGKTTRAETAGQHAVAGMSSPSTFAWHLGDGTTSYAAVQQGYRHANPETAGNYTFRNAGVSDFAVGFTGDSNIGAGLAAMFEVGNYMAPNIGGAKAGFHGAQVFYRGYIEDLTVSGRTYGSVDALDYAEYTKHVLTAGGRYYGDTVPTDPATIP